MTLANRKSLVDPTVLAQLKNGIQRFKQNEIRRLGIENQDALENLGLAHVQYLDWWEDTFRRRHKNSSPTEQLLLSFLNSMIQNVLQPGVASWLGKKDRGAPAAECWKFTKEYISKGLDYFEDLANQTTDRRAEDIKEAYRREQQMEWDMLSRSLEQAYEEARSLERKLLSQAERYEQHLKEQRQQYQLELERVRNNNKEKELQTALEKARLGQQMQLERHNAEVRALKAEIEKLRGQQEPPFYTFESTDPSEAMSLAIFTNNKMPAKEGGRYTLTVQTVDFKRWRAEVTNPRRHIQQRVSSKLGRAS